MRNEPKAVFRWFGVWFAFVAVLALGMLGLVVWAVITLVSWLVTK